MKTYFGLYAWNDDDFFPRKHPLARAAARWRGFQVGITVCGPSFWEHACVSFHNYNREWYWNILRNGGKVAR